MYVSSVGSLEFNENVSGSPNSTEVLVEIESVVVVVAVDFGRFWGRSFSHVASVIAKSVGDFEETGTMSNWSKLSG